MGKTTNKQLSQAEIWDDSALIQSWNDALAEYKIYHSIHARGERVEDVIKAFEGKEEDMLHNCTTTSHEISDTQAVGAAPDDLEDGELEEDSEEPGTVNHEELTEDTLAPSSYEAHPTYTHAGKEGVEQHDQAHSVPNTIVDGVNNEALKNLMMSWYYAGYYTGLYDGQQATRPAPK